jgi:CheY-like chemotaxis protein
MMDTPFDILVIEDDIDDQYLINDAFKQSAGTFNLKFASHGAEALEMISNHHYFPNLILLDINMPVMNGFEVLEQLRSSIHFWRIPVLVLTTSSTPADIDRAYELGATSLIIKPSKHGDLLKLVEQIKSYWFQLVTLPS